jgi:UDP-N-acetylmuramate: L-alanyl-gamma-D-glutamyl-meso-diaminopimelate ligase
MHIYILGICGTFMGSLAVLAREMGHQVSGCDANVYPPMSTQLEQAGIKLDKGFDVQHFACEPDLIIVGNAMSRGNVMVEHMLDKGLAYTSGPQFLHDHVIHNKWVLAVSGTHGKTTTSSMLAWILEYAGLKPGFLIGGVVNDFPFSARMGDSIFFVVEADEYDTAFFDKRSKFLHYMPRTLVMNNLEFDHADIFENLAAIKTQFHHLLRIVPSSGRVISNAADKNLAAVLAKGCWSEQVSFGAQGNWQATLLAENGSKFQLRSDSHPGNADELVIEWSLNGYHNIENAMAAVAAAEHVGVHPKTAVAALKQFSGVKRRMEKLASIAGIDVYDDFAHHPSAIKTSLAGMRSGEGRVLAVIEPRSNTMRMGVHKDSLAESVADADQAYWYLSAGDWQLPKEAGLVFQNMDVLLEQLREDARSGDKIIIMSNGGFSGFHQRLIQLLEGAYAE